MSVHPAAPEHLPRFFVAPGETDTSMVFMGIILVVAVMSLGILFLRVHTLPERIAHDGRKLQFEIVAVLGLLALFTGYHFFWVIGLFLALINIPDFGGAFSRIAVALERIGGVSPDKPVEAAPIVAAPADRPSEEAVPKAPSNADETALPEKPATAPQA